MKIIKRVSRQIPEALLNQLVYAPTIGNGDFAEQDKVESWTKTFVDILEVEGENGSLYSATVEHD